MNILDTLKSNFDCLEPIFDYEIYKLGYTDKDISDTLQKNVFEEIIPDKSFNIKSRVFNLVAYSEILDQYVPIDGKSEQLVIGYYIGRNNEYGYLTGFCSLNKLKLSNQVCGEYTISSLRADSEIRINIGIFRFIITKADEQIDKSKFTETMYINAFNNLKDYFDVSIDEAINIIESNDKLNKNYIYERINNYDDTL